MTDRRRTRHGKQMQRDVARQTGKYDEASKQSRGPAPGQRKPQHPGGGPAVGRRPQAARQRARVVAGVGRVAVAREPEVRARLKRAEQALDLLKKALVIFGQPSRRTPLSNCHAHAESFWRRFKAE